MIIGSINILKCFHFHFKAFDNNYYDIVTLHNLSMPLTYMVILYHNTMSY